MDRHSCAHTGCLQCHSCSQNWNPSTWQHSLLLRKQPQNYPYPELHVCPLAEPLLAGLGGGEDGHLLSIQLQNAWVLMPHHLWEDRSHWDVSHLRSELPSSCPWCSASPEPELSKGDAWTEVGWVCLLGIWLVQIAGFTGCSLNCKDKWSLLN